MDFATRRGASAASTRAGASSPSASGARTQDRQAPRRHRRRLRACAALRTEGEQVAKLLDAFDEVWDALVPEERREVLRALIARVGVDPESGTLRVTFHEPAPPTGPQPTTEATL